MDDLFPQKLLEYLPASAQPDFASIYGDLTVKLAILWKPNENCHRQVLR